jgi:hypothetical protein
MIYFRSERIAKCDKMCQVKRFEEKTTFTLLEAKVTISEITHSKRHVKDESGERNKNEDKVNLHRIQTLEKEITANRCE